MKKNKSPKKDTQKFQEGDRVRITYRGWFNGRSRKSGTYYLKTGTVFSWDPPRVYLVMLDVGKLQGFHEMYLEKI